MSSNTNDNESKKEVDIFRDTPIRYMGKLYSKNLNK